MKSIIPSYCNHCGSDLIAIAAQLESKRQVVEIPPINPVYIKFQSYSKTCNCGHKQIGELKPRLEEAKKNKRVVYFVDASHFVWGAFIGSLWCFV